MPLSTIPETLETLEWPYHLSDETLRNLETEIVKHPKLTAISAEIHIKQKPQTAKERSNLNHGLILS